MSQGSSRWPAGGWPDGRWTEGLFSLRAMALSGLSPTAYLLRCTTGKHSIDRRSSPSDPPVRGWRAERIMSDATGDGGAERREPSLGSMPPPSVPSVPLAPVALGPALVYEGRTGELF